MKQKNNQTKEGFTLIELLLYISLAAVILLTVSLFLSMLLNARAKNQVVAEVDQQGAQVMQLITQTIRNAEAINSPTQGNQVNSLSLDVVDAANDPTIFDLVANTIRISEGVSVPVVLTSARIIVSNLIFYNLTRNNTQGTIRIQYTLTHINPGSRNEFDYSKTYYGSATLR